ncbi:hypothetical protein ACOMHN_015390 [Nucella lapillus]
MAGLMMAPCLLFLCLCLFMATMASPLRPPEAEKEREKKERRELDGIQTADLETDDPLESVDEIMTVTFGGVGEEIKMAEKLKKEGEITTELDMHLTGDQYQKLYGHMPDLPQNKTKRKAMIGLYQRWPDNTVTYQIQPGIFTDIQIQEIKDGIAEWEHFTCLRFKEVGSEEKEKILFIKHYGCYSSLGRVGGTQVISLQDPGCIYKGTIVHEIGHAIGMIHEHQRPDRDDYVRIDINPVPGAMRSNFQRYNREFVDTMGVEYDYGSVMHYGKTAFSQNGKDQTIFPLDKSKTGQLGSRVMSFADAKLANVMYKCNERCTKKPSCPSPCFVDKNCKCFCEDDMTPDDACSNVSGNIMCSLLVSYNYCKYKQDSMMKQCRKACDLCNRPSTTQKPGKSTTTRPKKKGKCRGKNKHRGKCNNRGKCKGRKKCKGRGRKKGKCKGLKKCKGRGRKKGKCTGRKKCKGRGRKKGKCKGRKKCKDRGRKNRKGKCKGRQKCRGQGRKIRKGKCKGRENCEGQGK